MLADAVWARQQLHRANRIIAQARNRALAERTRFESERGVGAVPNAEHPTSLDLQYIDALDAFHEVHREIDVPYREAVAAWEQDQATRERIQSLKYLVLSLVRNTARSTFVRELQLVELGLQATLGVLRSRLTDDLLQSLAQRAGSDSSSESLRRYRSNNASFIATLDRLNFYVAGPNVDQRRGLHGGLPAEIAERVEATQLLTGPLTAILRRYQEFGARYLILQKRVLLGDDMGLGKTVQVLAAMSHLHALGARSFFVVAPNSVLLNWEREVRKHTLLPAFVAHGDSRDDIMKQWVETGGVAITTFGTLPKVLHAISHLDFIAIDEAHYAKNPNTIRTKAVQQLTERAEHVALMTGTALENRLEELRFLVELAQPTMAPILKSVISESIRTPKPDDVVRELAPVYLRRTQSDVLTELPERIVTDEWVELSTDDYVAYLAANPDIMSKRLAAIVGAGTRSSAKYERLMEIIEEHVAEKRKIVVFSYFRQVIDDVCALVGGAPQITGDVSSSRRQEIIDSFSASDNDFVLVSQVDAGGIGINLQAAQVVILMEAQLKPSTEWQAIARVHRMGQSRTVMVHRIFSRRTIEERLVEILAEKTQIFYAYAHDSAVRDVSLMAIDSRSVGIEEQLQQFLQDEGA